MTDRDVWPLKDGRFESVRFPSDVKKSLAALRTNNFTGALYIAKDYAVISAFAILASQVSWWFYPLALLFIGAHQRGLTTIAHDAAHTGAELLVDRGMSETIQGPELGSTFGGGPLAMAASSPE